ncbi:MAG TPA: hypothetical protein VHK24_04855 [Steroidobacter sp.]|jgi:hypothetical protein|nr:hypothetical protein [Steroidobacter sp.]
MNGPKISDSPMTGTNETSHSNERVRIDVAKQPPLRVSGARPIDRVAMWHIVTRCSTLRGFRVGRGFLDKTSMTWPNFLDRGE